MRFPVLVALVAAAVPVAARGQDAPDNPYRNAKVGDYATYLMTMKVGESERKVTVTNTVKALTDKEATIEVTGKMNGTAIPPQTQKIDLTRPFDPTTAGLSKSGGKADTKVEKVADGKESISAGGKSYDTTWTTYKVFTKSPAGDVTADVKAWLGKDIPLGLGKMEMTSMIAGMAMKMQLELIETGGAK
ncbi:MAG TPA: hypothetical protein VH092_23125 [Urbifossiella sp.]|jgi:hypothetical protein|nr:hypothetical protein [Urbifossiella sp.]